jgi:hypothetical protein
MKCQNGYGHKEQQMRERMDISAERNIHGAWCLSTIYGDRYFHHQYYFCTKREAIAEFRAFVKAGGK